MVKTILTVGLGILLLTGCGVQSAGTFGLGFYKGGAADSVCTGKAVGISFRSSDGCNTCSCDSSGHAVCTLMACQTP